MTTFIHWRNGGLPRPTPPKKGGRRQSAALRTVLAGLAERRTVELYDETEPRDETGKWTSDGGGAGTSKGTSGVPAGVQKTIDANNMKGWKSEAGQRAIDVQAAAHNMTPDQYRAASAAHVADVINGRPLVVQTGPVAAQAILNGDEFKNQFATDTTNGYIDAGNASRTDNERDLLGITSTSPADHPIYGSLFPTKDGAPDPTQSAATHEYGDFMFDMNDNVRDRATWTSQDSLVLGTMAGTGSQVSVGDVAHPGIDGMTVTSADDMTTWATPENPPKDGFIETQIHGPTDIHDVHAVYVNARPQDIRAWHDTADMFPSSKQSDAAMSALRSSGVPWYIRDSTDTMWVKGGGGAAAARLVSALVRLTYDENEPRDDKGRWTTDGGGASGASSGVPAGVQKTIDANNAKFRRFHVRDE
jgi:hypothetical protein